MIGNFGCSAHGAAIRSGTSGSCDGDGRRDPSDGITVRLIQSLKKLPGVGRETFDVATLTLGVERIECQRGLAAA